MGRDERPAPPAPAPAPAPPPRRAATPRRPRWAFVTAAAVLGLGIVVLTVYRPSGEPDGPRPIDLPGALPGFVDWSALPWGATAFAVPKQMRFDETRPVEMLVSPSHGVAQLEAMLAQQTKGLPVKVSPIMTATLKGSGFDIVEVSPPVQAIARDEPTRWQWTIKPRPGAYGVQLLTLSLWARVQVNGTDAERQVRTLNEEVRVTISPLERAAGFLGQNWQWFGTPLLALAAWWLKRRWFSDRKPPEPPA